MTELCIRLNEMTPALDAAVPPTDSRRRKCLRALEEGRYDEVGPAACPCRLLICRRCRFCRREVIALKDFIPCTTFLKLQIGVDKIFCVREVITPNYNEVREV